MSPRHVALLAYGPSLHQYLELAKAIGGREAFCDEVWTVNAVGSVLACDRVFHMDDVRIQEVRAAAVPDSNVAAMLRWLKVAKVPVYTSRAHPDYPSLVEFPLQDVLRSTGGIPYFNSTPAYAIALAMHLGVEIISLFGLDYTYADAHHAEKGRACIEFWLGKAIQRGVDVRISSNSTLMDSRETDTLYGYGRFSSRTPVFTRDDVGVISVAFDDREDLPSADEIEAAYDHSKHPSSLVSGATAKD